MVPMHDGVSLATDLYRPAHGGKPLDGRFPALLMRTPYNKEVRAAAFADYFAARGYVVVVQDVRGRYKSQGRWRPLYDDGHDGYDTAAWIGRQRWSDGGIGTLGTSYEGGTQHALAIAGAPYLKVMIPLFSLSDVGRYGVRHNGAFELRWFNWVFSMGDPGGEPNLVAAARAASDPAAAPALGAAGASGARVPAGAATASRHHAAEIRARLRELADRGHESRRRRCGVHGDGRRCGGSPQRLQGHSRLSRDRLVRLLGAAGGEPELPGAARSQEKPAAADRRPLDPQPPERELCRRGAVHSRCSHRSQSLRAALVRSLAEGQRQRRRPRGTGAHLRDGRW